jgi:acyl-CoA synthetase (AMP-forming)/AMP-acid ligase II
MSERWKLVSPLARFLASTPWLMPWSRVCPARLLAVRARQRPGDPALLYRDETYSYGDLDRRVDAYARSFAREGITAGGVVAILMDNRPDYVFAVMGLNRIGAVGSLINTNLSGATLLHALAACQAQKLVLGEEHLPKLEEVADSLQTLSVDKDVLVKLDDEAATDPAYLEKLRIIDPEIADAADGPDLAKWSPRNSDVFCYIYTSGTTGLPKPAIIRNQRMLGSNFTFGHLMHRSRPGDVIYVPLPLYHSSAMFVGLGAGLATGAAVALRRCFSASAFWDDVRRYGATSFVYVGELCRYLLHTPESPDERSHRLRVGVGNGMSPDVWRRFQERFGVPVIREFYGSTEGNAFMLNITGRPGMVGRLPRGQALVRCDPATGEIERDANGRCTKVQAGESGLLVGRISKMLRFDGYVDEKATSKKVLEDVFEPGDRYFNSGDLLQLHDGGWLSFSDRLGDTYRWKGENVSTGEVAQLIHAADGVDEANVYGVKVPGFEGRAGMVALRPTPAFDLDQFARYVIEKLPSYQRPVFLRILSDEMQITGTFKQRKVDYRDEAFDLERIGDPLYVLQGDGYVAIDRTLYERIMNGEFDPR